MIYSNTDDNAKRYQAQRYYLPKSIIKNYNFIINGKNFHDQPIDSDTKRYKERRKLRTGQSEDYTTRCLLDYNNVQKHYRLIAVGLSRQKESDAYPKAIQQIEFVGQLKNLDNNSNATDVGDDQSMFVLMILEKIKEARSKFSQGSVTVL